MSQDEINKIQIYLENLNTKMDDQGRKIDAQDKKIDLINAAIVGNAYGQKGLISEYQEHDDRISGLEDAKKKQGWFIAGISSAVTAMAGFLAWLFS